VFCQIFRNSRAKIPVEINHLAAFLPYVLGQAAPGLAPSAFAITGSVAHLGIQVPRMPLMLLQLGRN